VLCEYADPPESYPCRADCEAKVSYALHTNLRHHVNRPILVRRAVNAAPSLARSCGGQTIRGHLYRVSQACFTSPCLIWRCLRASLCFGRPHQARRLAAYCLVSLAYTALSVGLKFAIWTLFCTGCSRIPLFMLMIPNFMSSPDRVNHSYRDPLVLQPHKTSKKSRPWVYA
jgi:hypothetical protein